MVFQRLTGMVPDMAATVPAISCIWRIDNHAVDKVNAQYLMQRLCAGTLRGSVMHRPALLGKIGNVHSCDPFLKISRSLQSFALNRHVINR